MSYQLVDGLKYYVEEAGAGEPLILLHGFTGSTNSWRALMKELSSRYRVIAVDLPGHGQTDTTAGVERYTFTRVSRDLATLLVNLEVAPAHWLGYSMGGRLALYCAVNMPELFTSLILESASPGLESADDRRARRRQDEALADRIVTGGIPSFVDEWEQIPLFENQKTLSDETRSELRAQRLANHPIGLANSLRGMGAGVQEPLWKLLHEINVPTLLVVGRFDAKYVDINSRMAAVIPHSVLQIIEGAGHTVHLEQPGAFSDILSVFLRRISEEGRQNLPGRKQNGEEQRRQRHLLEPGI